MYIPGFSVLDLAFNCVFSELQGVRERLGNLEAVRLPQLEARLADAAAGRPSQDLLESLHGYFHTSNPVLNPDAGLQRVVQGSTGRSRL